jgi:hypothetical protein
MKRFVLPVVFALFLVPSCNTYEDDGGGGDTGGGDTVGTDGDTDGDTAGTTDGGADAAGDECDILLDEEGNTVSCQGSTPGSEVACPEGYQCSGLSAFWCYRGSNCDLPVCLSADARIDTPRGTVPVASLHVGDTVWTRAADGQRVSAPLSKVGNTRAPADHQMLRVVLSDGRTLRASPNHPDVTGAPLVALKAGARYDGARVVNAALEPYGQPRTYDVLPAGPTGVYWADGVPVGSTLRPTTRPARSVASAR